MPLKSGRVKKDILIMEITQFHFEWFLSNLQIVLWVVDFIDSLEINDKNSAFLLFLVIFRAYSE